MSSKNNTALVAIISALATVIIAAIIGGIICLFLFVFKGANTTDVPPAASPTGAPVVATPQPQATTMYVANVANSVYLRDQADENSTNITTIPVGAPVVWISDETPVFSKVSYGGLTGYVKRDYLSTTPPASKPAQTQGYTAYTTNTSICKYMYVANVQNSIYLRSTIYENPNNIITTIPLGTRVGFIEHASNDFDKINYNGTIGYVKTIYLSDYYTTPSRQYMTVCNVKTSIYLRSAPYENPNNIICEIPVNSTVEYLSNAGGGFYKISWNGRTGYSKSMYLR